MSMHVLCEKDEFRTAMFVVHFVGINDFVMMFKSRYVTVLYRIAFFFFLASRCSVTELRAAYLLTWVR